MDPETRSRRPTRSLLVALATALALAVPVHAEPLVDGVALSLGVFQALSAGKAGEGGLELRLRPLSEGLAERPWVLRPAVGGMFTTDETAYTYAGLRLEIPLSDRWTVVPQSAVGYYDRGDGKDLGGELQFRNALELSYRRDQATRVGAVLYHLSNAGFEKPNPGSESLVFFFAWR